MEIIIEDTYDLYNKMITLPEGKRKDFYEKSLLGPFDGYYKILQVSKDPKMQALLDYCGHDEEIKESMKKLKDADAWNGVRRTIEKAAEIMQKAGLRVPEKIVVGILLGDPELLRQSEGYAGNGSIPGYIQLSIVPDERNLAKLNACAAHEFHHNVLFNNVAWNFMNVSVGQYLAVEGLAESFAKSMFGEEFIGPWVTNVDEEGLERSRKIIADALSIKGFMVARMYMFGDHPMVPEAKSLGIPYCGGYAVGYHAVQSYLKKKDVSVAEATKIDGEELMKESGYFA